MRCTNTVVDGLQLTAASVAMSIKRKDLLLLDSSSRLAPFSFE